MYMKVERKEIIRIPPDRFNEDIDEVTKELTRKTFEGCIEGDSFTVLTTDIKRVGDGQIVHGNGSVYQPVSYEAIVFRPQLQEVVEGIVCEVLKFGAFVRFGPLDGLLHISQIMDDRINVDSENQRLLGKETKRDLRVGDKVRVRIVAVSINDRNPRESKIGLTMRQPGLGKLEWIEEDRKKGKAEEKEEKKK